MRFRFKFHRLASFIVLVAAGIWVGTGKFTRVGSEKANAGQQVATQSNVVPQEATVAAVNLRTVSAITPVFLDHARELRLSGVTAPDQSATLAARSDGIIHSIALDKGATMKAGSVVMTLEGPDMVAALSISEVAHKQQLRDLNVAERLFAGGSLSETQVTNARFAAATAEAQVKQARAAVDLLSLKAPFDGLVDTVSVERGEWVQTGTPIGTLLSLDPIVVRAEVSELDIDIVAIGAKARVRLVSGAEMSGQVRFVAKEASSDTRTYRIEVALPNPDIAIPSGMTADVRLYADPVRTVTVPRSVITLSDTGEIGLRLVDDKNIALFASVELIDDTAGGLILAGIPERMRIIVAGQDLVRDGEEVIVVAPPDYPAMGAGE